MDDRPTRSMPQLVLLLLAVGGACAVAAAGLMFLSGALVLSRMDADRLDPGQLIVLLVASVVAALISAVIVGTAGQRILARFDVSTHASRTIAVVFAGLLAMGLINSWYGILVAAVVCAGGFLLVCDDERDKELQITE